MAFLDKTGLQNLTNKLVQGDAIKVASHRGKNVKEVIDNIQRECENVALPNTMTLENRISKFKVGQGRDVDVSGDVEEGKIEVELQGKTWQNLVEYIADYEGYEKNGFYYSKNASRKLSFGLKPNTVYTRILDVKECFEPFWMYDSINNSDGTYRQYSYRIKQGLVINKFTSSDLGTINSYTFNPDQNVTNKENFNIVIGRMILLEGDYTQTPVEELPKYFEGIKSSFEDGIVDVEVQGKNLWNNDNIYEASYTNWIPRIDLDNAQKITGYQYVATNTLRGIATIIKVKPNTYYTVNIPSIKTDNKISIAFYEEIEQINKPSTHCINYYSNIASNSYTFKTPQIECYMVIGLFGDYAALKNGNVLVEGFRNMQVTQLKIVTSYEPYYKKKISFNIGEPLRSLPNGVCDEIRNNNGQWELVRRIGKCLLDGSNPKTELNFHAVIEYEYNSNCNKLIINYCKFFNKSKVAFCDNLPFYTTAHSLQGNYIYPYNRTNHFYIVTKKELNLDTVPKYQQWLQSNPITLYYELETPIIAPIEPIEFEVKPLATMTINSDIAPISKHKVVLNRAGQIEQGIQLIADLRNRINTLESIYDSNLIATQYKLDNLKLNYELEREED